MTNLYMFVVFIKNPKKRWTWVNNWVHNSWTRWDPLDNPTATSARAEVASPGRWIKCHAVWHHLLVGLGYWGQYVSGFGGGHNCWEFGGDTTDVSLQKLKPFFLRHVGPSGITAWVAAHTDQRVAVRLIGVILWFTMKTLNLYRFLNSCPNQLFFLRISWKMFT